uniref:Uncharacterized protein n=1 Tax=Arundo donax TaxID=35708 RepID=A0A0A9ELP8_ARUDO
MRVVPWLKSILETTSMGLFCRLSKLGCEGR